MSVRIYAPMSFSGAAAVMTNLEGFADYDVICEVPFLFSLRYSDDFEVFFVEVLMAVLVIPEWLHVSLFMALPCSFHLCLKDRAVWPMYIALFEHLQVYLYTPSFLWVPGDFCCDCRVFPL